MEINHNPPSKTTQHINKNIHCTYMTLKDINCHFFSVIYIKNKINSSVS